MIKLKYGNTNTFFVGGLLIDTDMASTLGAFLKELKAKGIAREDIKYVFATHYHPDHMGLIGALMQSGVKLILPDFQKEYVHSSDYIFEREKSTAFVPIDESAAVVVSEEGSRAFLRTLGIDGRIIKTDSHSPDGAALILDDGSAFTGDLEPLSNADGYSDRRADALRADWKRVIAAGAKKIWFAHAPEKTIE